MISGEQATYVEQSVLLTVGMGFTQDGGHRGERNLAGVAGPRCHGCDQEQFIICRPAGGMSCVLNVSVGLRR